MQIGSHAIYSSYFYHTKMGQETRVCVFRNQANISEIYIHYFFINNPLIQLVIMCLTTAPANKIFSKIAKDGDISTPGKKKSCKNDDSH